MSAHFSIGAFNTKPGLGFHSLVHFDVTNLLNQARICFSENLVLFSQMWRSAGVRKEPLGKYFEVTFETRSNTLYLYLGDLREYLMHLIVFNVEKQGRFWGQLQISFSQLELTQLFSELLVQGKLLLSVNFMHVTSILAFQGFKVPTALTLASRPVIKDLHISSVSYWLSQI